MKVRVFTADSIQEAMAQVKGVLGRDAIILHTRKIRRGGIFGYFLKEKVEVTAAIETPIAPPVSAPSVQKIEPNSKETSKDVAVQFELASMRNLLEKVLHKIPKDGKSSPALELLINNDIDINVAEKILQELPVDSSKFDTASFELRKMIIAQIQTCLECVSGIEIPKEGRKIVAFIGPTGVGKTTTIAKLAAKFAIQDGYQVALVTADTYRISAVEQLKTYSDIMGMPIHIVYDGDELKKVLNSNKDKQLILIDTAGRSPHNSDQIEELQSLLQIDETIEKYLVLSATTKYKDALDIVKKFSVCSPDKVIFTKIDETRNIGTIINLLHQFPLSLSYVTNGQNVPDDIELVDFSKLTPLILRD
ncbi:flagellar biosynthesis protein FlhF [Pelosinus sp. UFO1]|uniref:flagellar biosynthesis protein FlhF n=1 Tax=Pelosinus sp. UFO1 TaxID=484770 RepID=UPI000571779F|nr:flagellar biosynthesis protein FlhF [Pelosinus sp. UFO1]